MRFVFCRTFWTTKIVGTNRESSINVKMTWKSKTKRAIENGITEGNLFRVHVKKISFEILVIFLLFTRIWLDLLLDWCFEAHKNNFSYGRKSIDKYSRTKHRRGMRTLGFAKKSFNFAFFRRPPKSSWPKRRFSLICTKWVPPKAWRRFVELVRVQT